MRLEEYIAKVDDLKVKKNELEVSITEGSTGHAKTILETALVELDAELEDLEKTVVEPVPFVVTFTVSGNANLALGSTSQLAVTATLNDGTTRDITKARYSKTFFKDFDTLYNNTGFITAVDSSAYVGAARDFFVVKTSGGFDASDKLSTQGLQVAGTGNTNEYEIRDLTGAPIGVKFTTDGAEAVGDNWKFSVQSLSTETTYLSTNELVATVNENGLVTPIAVGAADIQVLNNGVAKTITITVA